MTIDPRLEQPHPTLHVSKDTYFAMTENENIRHAATQLCQPWTNIQVVVDRNLPPGTMELRRPA